ncbi:Uncharacterised protein [Chryseobacterium taklimakanense]|uniref:Uncharacterized protein n=1 Tax=Chryseobacterium taklimakanense TaxID=536441 RepID=A0A239WF48_9FLAO|nr:hypothetical protein [Chryseobacterium taklimakanense]SNV32234.1 Uncharacterised protein [Chryseobacterium taklimakanense]
MRLYLLTILMFFITCKGQDKEEKVVTKTKSEIHVAKCENQYSTGQKVNEHERNWSLSNDDISQILKLSSEITEQDLHYTYPKTPCNIDVNNFSYNGRNYDLQINGGSYLTTFDGKETKIFGCDARECQKYFLMEKEDMEEKTSENTEENKSIHELNLNQKNSVDKIIVTNNNDSTFTFSAEIDGREVLNKDFECDNLVINTKTKNGQSFNIEITYSDQYHNAFRKIVIPIFYKNQDFYIEKLFIATKGTNAKTGNEEWFNKEIDDRTTLENLNIIQIIDTL